MESNRNIGEQTVLLQTKVDKITSKINPKVFAKATEFSSKIPPIMKSIGVLCSMFSGGTPSAGRVEYYNNGTIPFIRSGEINSEATELFLTEKGLANSAAKLVKKGDLLLALYGATSGEVGISKISGAINQAVLCIRSSQLNTLYLKNLLIFEKARILNTYLQGGQGNLSAEIIKSLKFPFPPLAEQKRIAEVLSIWDVGIERLERVIALKEKCKRALMQRLLSGKTRLPGFSAPWKEVKLGEIVSIVSRTVGCSRVVAMSISAGRGFVPQSEKFGRDISGKQYEKYTLLKLGEFAYNKGNSKRYPQGCVYRLKEHKEVAIPNVFISFRVDETLCFPQFMESYFEANKHGKWLCRVINSGVRNNGLLNLNTEDFLKMPVGLPSLEEQVSIAEVLLAAVQELSFLRRKCELLKLQKKWLMQQLLTGKKRLVK